MQSRRGKRTLLVVCIVVITAALAIPASRRQSSVDGLLVEAVPGHEGLYRTAFEVMGTDARLQVAAADRKCAGRMLKAATREAGRVEALMSTYRADSELSRLNQTGARQPVALSAQTRHVLQAAGEMCRLTEGAFDITYAPLRGLWRRAREHDRVPAQAEVDKVLGVVGYGNLILERGGARLAKPDVQVDLGGIAKGYAIDLATEALRAAGARSAIVDIGGDMRLLGMPDDGRKWRIEVRRPPGVSERIVLELGPCAVTTSGDYARGFRVADKWFSHIIDPRTGWPVENVPSVTVVAPDAMTADALATGLNVMGPERGIRLVDDMPEVECMMMVRLPDGTVEKHLSAGFENLMGSP